MLGMGVLTYEPEYKIPSKITDLNLDIIANECEKVLQTEYTDALDALDTLYTLGGTSGGARLRHDLSQWCRRPAGSRK